MLLTSLRCQEQTCWLVDHRSLGTFERDHGDCEERDLRSALWMLRQIDPSELLAVFGDHPLLRRRLELDPSLAIERLRGALEAGTLRFFVEPPREIDLTLEEPMDLLEGYEEPTLELPRHWIEVRLVDEDEQPRNGERYHVVLADGTEVSGQLDRNGVTRIPDVPGGPCRWSFPELHPDEWDMAS